MPCKLTCLLLTISHDHNKLTSLLPQLICLQPPSETATTNANSCDSDNLTYDCECADGLRPNVTQYTQTLPFFICQEWGNQCVNNCGAGNNDCASDCRENHPCGAQDPIKPNSTSSSSTMTGSASRTASDAGATTDSSESTGGSGGFVRASTTGDDSSSAQESASSSESAGVGRASGLEFGYTFGVVALAGVFFGGFALAL